MGVTGTGERRTTTGGGDGSNHGRRGGGPRRRPRPAGGRSPAGPGPERLEARVLFAAVAETPVANMVWKGATVEAHTDEWVVKQGAGADFTRLAAKQGFTAVKSLGMGYFQFDSTLSTGAMAKLAAAHPKGLGSVQPNMVVKAQTTLPNDTRLAQQWGVNNSGQLESFDYNINGVTTPYDAQLNPTGLPAGATNDFPSPPNPNENHVGTAGDDIHTSQAWDITTGSKNVVVAVVDTGIDLTHPDLVNNIWTNPLDTAANGFNGDGYAGDIHGYDFVNDDADPTDDDGHGTNVAGIIGAQGNNQQGIAGVNWNVSLVAVKVLGADGSGTTASIVAGINYVTNLKNHGINVVAINESLGGSQFPTDVLESEAVRQAGRAGILDVVAAGNSSVNVDATTTAPAQFSASIPNVVTVAAVDNQFQLASFSNYGSATVDLAAPGVNIFSTFPTDTSVYEYQQQLASLQTVPAYYQSPGLIPALGAPSGYGWESGTSQATPFVTGTIALMAAANPNATAAQLKNALLKSTTYDPALAAANGKPALVATSGVLNTYQAVLDVMTPFDGSNTTRGGTWTGYYGSQGAYVVGDATPANPASFVTVSTDGGSPVIVSNRTNNPAALQRVTDPTQRVSAYQASATTETIHLAFTDGAAHRTSLYLVDPDHKRRTETVNLVDPVTGGVLDSEVVSNFSKGVYLSWDLKGTVDLVVNSNAGGAAYSGVFFDIPQVHPGTYVGTDATTAGANWRNTYGSQGSFVAGDGDNRDANLPGYVSSLTVANGSLDVLRALTRDPRALQKTSDTTHNIEAYYASPTFEDVNLTMNDGLTHVVSLYLADYDNRHRTERVQVIDSTTGGVLVTQDVQAFKAGQFVSFAVSGQVTFRVIRTGGPNAVVSGVFFDAAFGANAYFAGSDATTGGNYTAVPYGATAAYVVGDDFPTLDVNPDQHISITGASRGVLATATADRRALLRQTTPVAGTAAARVKAYAFSSTSMTISYVPGDSVQHQLALYFADYEGDRRAETVTIYNPTTKTVLTRQLLTNFQAGKYLVYDVVGPVNIEIDNNGPVNAVISGVFVD